VGVSSTDIERLYREHGPRLARILHADARVPEDMAEDACQVAWGRLLARCGSLGPEAVLAWVLTTAIREAGKLAHQQDRACSLEAAVEKNGDGVVASSGRPPHEHVEHLERLRELGQLSPRQQRVLWLQALGFSYAEIARLEGCSLRTAERQLLRAQRKARRPRAADAQAAA